MNHAHVDQMTRTAEALVADAPIDRRLPATVELREALGSDVVIHFTIAAPPGRAASSTRDSG